VRLRLGDAPFHRHLDAGQLDRLATTTLPLASARLHLEPDDPRDELVRAVLREDGLELEQMKLKGIHSLFFSKGERAALCRPAGLTADSSPDDRHPGRFQLRLAFELPRGSYATLVVKRLQAS
jgi:tRNA pseudouridine13 synthase